ncbi:MAG: hypothetical protein O8C66_13905 [Candidatus Methanoperedens sp.]|nr:hypothetical protein [Candidatus Methanoperedens sp.]MCZ7371593.1 hypothetical protein [Candidatus Methanoperedens sp.]
MSKKDRIVRLMEEWGGRFSARLGIDIDSERSEEIFKWFLASILFGARIRQEAAMQTYREFQRQNVLTPEAILSTGWNGLVVILDAGGYVRYDFKTATKLLEISEMLNKRYGGDLNRLHEEALDPRDLESRLMEFKGVGPVTVNIFLRELRGIWKKAEPLPVDVMISAARALGLTGLEGKNENERLKILRELEGLLKKEKLPYSFPDLEDALVKFGIAYRRKKHQ